MQPHHNQFKYVLSVLINVCAFMFSAATVMRYSQLTASGQRCNWHSFPCPLSCLAVSVVLYFAVAPVRRCVVRTCNIHVGLHGVQKVESPWMSATLFIRWPRIQSKAITEIRIAWKNLLKILSKNLMKTGTCAGKFEKRLKTVICASKIMDLTLNTSLN
jgi:hypothetical protein